jgi:energy-coupling factor transporter ATP-binding protein EcfA2
MQNDAHQALSGWFDERPRWVREALNMLLEKGTLSAQQLQTLVGMCRNPDGVPKAAPVPVGAFSTKAQGLVIRLKSLSEPKGIDALNPRTPLTFGAEQVTIVYGLNGAGKSGYIRILNHVCGSKNRRRLIGHVFAGAMEQSCKVGYEMNGVAKEILWQPAQGMQDELSSMEIYDSEGGLVYVTEDNEVAFEPWLLGIFQTLIDTCGKIDGMLNREIAALASAKPALPAEYSLVAAATWYSGLKATTPAAEIATWTTFTKAQQENLANLQARLLEKNPADQAKGLRTRATAIRGFLSDWRRDTASVSAEAVAAVMFVKTDAAIKEKAAKEDAEKVFSDAPLDGVGLDSWKLLWSQARAYSEAEAYTKEVFPFVGEGARCVLCQQYVGEDAAKRLAGFERFVKGALETQAKEAAKALTDLIDNLPKIPSTEDLDVRLATLGLNEEPYSSQLHFYRDALVLRCSSARTATKADEMSGLPDAALLATLNELVAAMDMQAKAFEADALKTDKAALKMQITALEALKWIGDQKVAVEAEVVRLAKVAALESAGKRTDTTALSKKKAELAQQLVSEAFIQRFDEELKALGANRIKVELVRTNTAKGHVYHRIKLKGAKLDATTAEVLSEGERRIVSLAAFLADVEGVEANTPFVFDDPISSLDQDFEEAVVARLVKLAKKRQVVVFTHRLSLPAMLEDALDVAGLSARVVALNREAWGSGQPGSSPVAGLKPKAALNSLDAAVSRARKAQRDIGQADYEIQAKAICSDLRILLERMVEDVLLNKIVQRYRRGVQTDGKIKHLAKITPADTELVDDIMTKYSKFVHSQPFDVPVAVPEPDDIAADIATLLAWEKEFTNRMPPVAR